LLKRLTAQLGLPFVGDIKTVTARVVSGPVSNFDNIVVLGKGRADGISSGMPVVTRGGLVGVVSNVSDHRAIVTLVTDPGFRVGVRLSRTDQIGVARGQGRGRPLIIDSGVDANVKIRRNELVTTSGLNDSLFPPDVPVGKVLSSAVSEGDLDQRVVVQPVADVDALTFVDVMLWKPKN
jgi:rod shape-determining protein MreC